MASKKKALLHSALVRGNFEGCANSVSWLCCNVADMLLMAHNVGQTFDIMIHCVKEELKLMAEYVGRARK